MTNRMNIYDLYISPNTQVPFQTVVPDAECQKHHNKPKLQPAFLLRDVNHIIILVVVLEGGNLLIFHFFWSFHHCRSIHVLFDFFFLLKWLSEGLFFNLFLLFFDFLLDFFLLFFYFFVVFLLVGEKFGVFLLIFLEFWFHVFGFLFKNLNCGLHINQVTLFGLNFLFQLDDFSFLFFFKLCFLFLESFYVFFHLDVFFRGILDLFKVNLSFFYLFLEIFNNLKRNQIFDDFFLFFRVFSHL